MTSSYDCNGSGAQRWTISSSGNTIVRVAQTPFCLDAGSSESLLRIFEIHKSLDLEPLDPGNGVQMKIWQCYDQLPAQRWIVTSDNRIVLAGTSTLRLVLFLIRSSRTNDFLVFRSLLGSAQRKHQQLAGSPNLDVRRP